jgi:hypothetical protein
MNNITSFRKHYQCDNCESQMIRNDTSPEPSYCSYGCGALSQSQYCKSVLKSTINKE